MTLATPTPEAQLDPAVEQAIVSRHSMRAFLPMPVPRETVTRLLQVAARAPSSTNVQPWKTYVLTGATKARLSEALVDAHFHAPGDHQPEHQDLPASVPEPYKSRQRQVGWELLALCGVQKGDRDAGRRQHARNYRFFDAPVGLIFTLERAMEAVGIWFDYGMYLQNIMTAARGMGLHTCPQAAFRKYHRLIREQLSIPDNEIIVCGMALGHADMSAPENSLVTPREPVESYTTFLD